MKNIHVLPTPKPSRLIHNVLGYAITLIGFTKSDLELIQAEYQNIYITSDEEIKEGSFAIIEIDNTKELVKVLGIDTINNIYEVELLNINNTKISVFNSEIKKIILTTDQDLIKEGVQAIDDEFLEWFVKNPSCEFVEVVTHYPTISDEGDYSLSKQYYTLTIPKEEPNPFELPKALPDDVFFKSLEEPKQETAEEAAVINYKELYQGEPLTQEVPIDAFIEGAKWQQEQYEILFDEYHEYTVDCIEVELKRPLPLQKWFKQFKKK
jgi:hypothetical protein